MTESVEVVLARLDERLNMVLAEQRESKKAREATHDAIAELLKRVENVEKQVAGSAPTIQEFVTIKNKVIGAGKVGKWLWMLFGVVLGALVTGRMNLSHLFKWN